MSKRKRNNGLVNRSRVILATAAAVLAASGVAAFFAFTDDDAPRRVLRQDPVTSDAREVTVKVIDRDYAPRDLTIDRGATVTWAWDGDLPHNVVDDRGRFESPILRAGDEWSLRFDEPGDFYYYCTLHHVMQGTVRVVD